MNLEIILRAKINAISTDWVSCHIGYVCEELFENSSIEIIMSDGEVFKPNPIEFCIEHRYSQVIKQKIDSKSVSNKYNAIDIKITPESYSEEIFLNKILREQNISMKEYDESLKNKNKT